MQKGNLKGTWYAMYLSYTFLVEGNVTFGPVNIIRLFTYKDWNEVQEIIHIITLSSNVVM